MSNPMVANWARWIKTELGNAGPNAAGMAEALEDMQETIKALVSLVCKLSPLASWSY
jgi:hypothetical protein